MSIEVATSAPSVAATEASATRAAPSPTAKPARDKRALLNKRRLAAGTLRCVARRVAASDDALLLQTGNAAVTFVLMSSPSGLLVERTQRRPLGVCVIQNLLFTDRGDFVHWCERDRLRFDEPVLFDRLLREGHARFADPR